MRSEIITYTALRQNLSSVLDNIENNRDKYFVTRKQHEDVVMISREDYDSMVETLHLLSNAANAKRLNQSLKQASKDKFVKVDI